MNKNVGKIIKNKRKKLKLTQEDIAKKLNVTASTISNWETNSNFPEKELIPKICEVLKIKEDKLYNNRETIILEEMRKKDKNIIGVIKFIVLFLGVFVLFSTASTLYVNTYGMHSKTLTEYKLRVISDFISVDDKVKKQADENLNKIKNSSSSNYTNEEKEALVAGLEKMSKSCNYFKEYKIKGKNNYEISIEIYELFEKAFEGEPYLNLGKIFKKDNRSKEIKEEEKAYQLFKKMPAIEPIITESRNKILMSRYEYPGLYDIIDRIVMVYYDLGFSYGEYYLALTEYALKVGGINE